MSIKTEEKLKYLLDAGYYMKSTSNMFIIASKFQEFHATTLNCCVDIAHKAIFTYED